MKGLINIKTHGSLSRQGLLVSVARDLHRTTRTRSESESKSEDWNTGEQVLQKPKGEKHSISISAPVIAKLINSEQIKYIYGILAEMERAIADGISTSLDEFERLKKKLAELQGGD